MISPTVLMPLSPIPDARDDTLWAEGFGHGYAGFVIRQTGGDRSYAAGYTAGQALRQAHRADYDRTLLEGRRMRPVADAS